MPTSTGRAPRGLFVGLCTVDLRYTVADLPAIDEKIVALSQDLSAGGPASNAAITFSALGGDATLVTALGQHPLAQIALADLEAHGVKVIDVLSESTEPPAISTIMVKASTGERSVVSINASRQQASPPSNLAQLVGQADVLLVDGHHPALALAAARSAHDAEGEEETPVVLDAGSWKAVFEELLPHVDHPVCSGTLRVPEPMPSRLATHIKDDPTRSQLWTLMAMERRCRAGAMISMTNGDKPVVLLDSDSNIQTMNVPTIAAKDTVGAGDAFHGAYAYEVARSKAEERRDFEQADFVHVGICVASIRCTVDGPRNWLKIDAFAAIKQYANSSATAQNALSALDTSLAPWRHPFR